MTELLQPTYWLTMNPPEVEGLLGTSIFIFFILCFICGIVGHIVADRKNWDRFMRQAGHKFSTLLTSMGILGIILFFFSFEEIRLFGARFWYPLWGLGFIFWGYIIFRFLKRDIPTLREREALRMQQNRYLPGRKRK